MSKAERLMLRGLGLVIVFIVTLVLTLRLVFG